VVAPRLTLRIGCLHARCHRFSTNLSTMRGGLPNRPHSAGRVLLSRSSTGVSRKKATRTSAVATCSLTFSGRRRALLKGPSAAMRTVRNGQDRTQALDRASPPSWVALEAPACRVARRSLQFRARLAHAQIHCLLGPPRARGRLPILHRAVLERLAADPCDEHRWCV
jgi:hypothetical protein